MKKVTVVVATYNGEQFIGAQLGSVLSQTFKDFEIIIRDDLSTDDTFTIIKEYESKYPGIIKVYRNNTRVGVVKNFERLIGDATGEYIALCDQDDVWCSGKLETAIDELESLKDKQMSVLFHSDLEMVDDGLNNICDSLFAQRGYFFNAFKSVDVMLGRSGIMGNTMVFNQNLKNKILPFPDALVVHDYWIALVNEIVGKRITHNKPLVKYRLHNQNTSLTLRGASSDNFFHRDITLPYHNLNRESVIRELLDRFDLGSDDVLLVDDFLNYLEFEKNKLYVIALVFKHNFFRLGFFYKLKLAGAILWKRK